VVIKKTVGSNQKTVGGKQKMVDCNQKMVGGNLKIKMVNTTASGNLGAFYCQYSFCLPEAIYCGVGYLTVGQMLT